MPDIIPIINCNLQWRQRQAIYAKQGEYGARKVKIFLYNGSNSYEVPDSGISAVFAYKRPDGFSDSYDTIDGVDAIALSSSDNSATVTLAQNVLAVPGTVECELQLLTSGTMIATFTFYIIVEASVAPGTEPSEQTTNPFVRSPADIGSGYAICSTAAATTAKTAQIDGYKLTIGGRVSIRFDNAVPANATLNISNTGAKDIYYHGSIVTGSLISAGDLVTFVYNGVRYCVTAIDASQSSGGGGSDPIIVTVTNGVSSVSYEDIVAYHANGRIIRLIDSIGLEYDLLTIDSAHSVAVFYNAVNATTSLLYNTVSISGTTATPSSMHAYVKPQGGIPATDLAFTPYTKPSGGIPPTDMSSAVQTSLGKADTAYQKPGGGIPLTDLAGSVETPATVVQVSGNTPTIDAPAGNTIYKCTGDVTQLTVQNYGYTEFVLKFNTSLTTDPTVTIDSRIWLPDGFTFEKNRHYEMNVDSNGFALIADWVYVD